jgi:LIVCS family branched-chain amino acid:cation transporter
VLIIKGIISPVGEIISYSASITAANAGFLAGYQTMDVLGALAFTIIMLSSVREKGYNTLKSSMAIVGRASIVTVVGLFLVYGGLSYLGATSSSLHMGHHNQAALLVEITGMILGNFGKILLGVIVFFACMTTAVGLASSSSDFFFQLFKEKVPYQLIVAVICGVSYLLSNVGITMMIAVATPMLNILYPLLLTQIILSFFNNKIKKDTIFKGAAIGALIVCVLSVAADMGAPTTFVYRLPFSSLGLYWIIPAAIGAVVGAFIPEKK